jgi:hypothetical protein
VVDKRKAGKRKGPKGGVKHTPGRGHTHKSGPQKRKRFQKKAAKRRRAKQDDLRKQWADWDSLPPAVQKLRPDLKPKMPRPKDES